MKKTSTRTSGTVVGMDLGDQYSHFYMMDSEGEEIEKGRVRTTRAGISKRFSGMEKVKVVVEAGTHSAWVSRLLKELGHEVVVANPRKVQLISANSNKNDGVDGELLARLGRADEKLLHPIQHRREQSQADLELLKARDQLVAVRRKLINPIRGAVKSMGGRLKNCGAESFHQAVKGEIPEPIARAVEPLWETIKKLTQPIRDYSRQIEKLCREEYQETELLQLLRRLLVQSAQYILGPFGKDCELRRWGLKLAGRGRKNAKKRAVVAVARKLAVLLHRLWVNGEVYDPFYGSHQHQPMAWIS